MIRIFIDSSVLFAAAKSSSGASYALMVACKKGKFEGLVTEYVLREVRRNASAKFNQVEKQRLNKIVLGSKLKRVPEAVPKHIATCCEVIKDKDAPVLAASLEASVEYLVTLDYKDFLTPTVYTFAKPLIILTPRDLIQRTV